MKTKKIAKLKKELGKKMLQADDIIEKISESVNLKLYDVSYYVYENNIDIMYFDHFCENEFYFFEEFVKEEFDIELGDFKKIGRTSSFYCTTFDIDDFKDLVFSFFATDSLILYPIDYLYDFFYFENFSDIIKFYDNGFNSHKYELIKFCTEDYPGNTLQERIEQAIEQAIGELNYLLNKLITFEKVFDCIEDFKKNQVEYFKESYFLMLERGDNEN